MSINTDNYRFVQLASLALLTLFISSSADVSAYEEQQVRKVNKRVWSIIKGKVVLDKSAYSVKRVRITTPKVELIKPPPPDEKERIPAEKLRGMVRSSLDYKIKINEKKELSKYTSSSKGSAKSFHENNLQTSKFCSTATASSFCLREDKPNTPYFGESSKKKSRKKDFSDRNTYNKIQQSIEFVEELVKQSNY